MGRILLVRHGQASWGAADYDQLSTDGEEQSRQLGGRLGRRGTRPDLLVHGGMKRHRQTLAGMVESASWDTTETEDPGWAEFDHVAVLAGHPAPWGEEPPPSKEAFQAWFEEALAGWMAGGGSDDDVESFSDFTSRVEAALRRTADQLAEIDPSGTAVVSTSGGPVSWAVAHLVGGSAETWRPLNRVVVNSSVTTVVAGRSGLSMLTFNEHAHLAADLITYR